MCCIPLCVADIRIHSHYRIDDRYIPLGLRRAIPAVFLHALLALCNSGNIEFSGSSVNSRTAKTLHPVRVQSRIALRHQVPRIDQDLVHVDVAERTREPCVVRIRTVRGVGHVQCNRAGCGVRGRVLRVASEEHRFLGIVALDERRWRWDFRDCRP